VLIDQNIIVVDYSVQVLNSSENLVLMVPAEGTRERVEKWKLTLSWLQMH
jgi:hypothetical protein